MSHRLEARARAIAGVALLGKMNGAVGNYNAHLAAYPEVDWERFARELVDASRARVQSLYTIQIEPHDAIAELFDAYAAPTRSSSTSTATCGATSRWATSGRSSKAGEVGSSTMPHKVNPIDFENSEGNLGLRQRAAAAHERKAAGLALAARPHRFDRAAQHGRRAGPHAARLRLVPARARQARSEPRAPGGGPRRRTGKCSPSRSRR